MAGKKPVGLEDAKYTKMVKMPVRSLVIIGLTTDDGPEHPDYDSRIELPLDKEMLASIADRGVDKVVDIAIVDGQPVVIDGRQRVRHALAALDATDKPAEHPAYEVDCKVWRLSDVERARFAIRANAHRQDDDPVTEAEKAERLTDMSAGDAEICLDFGWSIGTLRNRRKLIDGTLPKSVLNMVRAGKLTVSAAMALHKRAQADEDLDIKAEAAKLAEGGKSKQAARARAASVDTPVRPGVRLVAKIVSSGTLSPEVTKALQWTLGELEPAAIKGLTAAIRDASTPPKPAGGKKAPPRLGK